MVILFGLVLGAAGFFLGMSHGEQKGFNDGFKAGEMASKIRGKKG